MLLLNQSFMNFLTVGHVSGTRSTNIDFTARIPWLYVITALGSKIVYIGETYDQSGVISRLSSHFGAYTQSTLKKNLEKITSINTLYGPYLIVCARLPFADDKAPFDASAKQIRLACENILHNQFASKFTSTHPGWTIVSSPQNYSMSDTLEIETACESIYKGFEHAYEFLKGLSETMPFQIVVLDAKANEPLPSKKELGQLIEDAEVILYEWILEKLKNQLKEQWWEKGIKETIRVQCVTRREEENAGLPPEAYLTLIHLQDIVKTNWSLFQNSFQEISGKQGKDSATKWIKTLNEARKPWAHPIKRIHKPIDPSEVLYLRQLIDKVKNIISQERVTRNRNS